MSKKSSAAETASKPNSSDHSSATAVSVTPAGSTKSAERPMAAAMSSVVGSGSALRSTLPLDVVGMRVRPTNADGTMYSGMVARTTSFNSATCECTCEMVC